MHSHELPRTVGGEGYMYMYMYMFLIETMHTNMYTCTHLARFFRHIMTIYMYMYVWFCHWMHTCTCTGNKVHTLYMYVPEYMCTGAKGPPVVNTMYKHASTTNKNYGITEKFGGDLISFGSLTVNHQSKIYHIIINI